MRLIVIASFCVLLCFGAAFAQSDRGTITGTVTDPAKAMIPNVPIEAKNLETGAVYQAASSATGNYTIAQLPVGTYQLTASMTLRPASALALGRVEYPRRPVGLGQSMPPPLTEVAGANLMMLPHAPSAAPSSLG